MHGRGQRQATLGLRYRPPQNHPSPSAAHENLPRKRHRAPLSPWRAVVKTARETRASTIRRGSAGQSRAPSLGRAWRRRGERHMWGILTDPKAKSRLFGALALATGLGLAGCSDLDNALFGDETDNSGAPAASSDQFPPATAPG